ncbi:MAG TPA: phage portal protein, partial [Bacteroidales bacterium]|nr:phage portal protein [Bacteroidales bacterium]
MTSQDIIKLLDYTDARIMSEVFNDIIKENTQFRIDTQKLYEEYDGEVEILNRKRPVGVPDYKANNKIPNDFFSMIVDQGITYTFGKPIVTELGEVNEKTQKEYKDFKHRNNLDDLDLETALYTSICGTSGRLCYIDKQGFERVTALAPWEVAYVYNRTNGELEYAMVYYQMEVIDFTKQGKQKTKVWFIEWYDKTDVRFYIEKTNEKNVFQLDESQEKPIMQHGFSEVPLVEVINNDAKKGDFVRVKELKNAYDRLVSDAQNELEDFRSAYMKFKGIIPDPKTMELAKQTGAFGSEDEDFDVDFLVKELNGEYLEKHKKTLVDNIFKFSKRVDMNDEKFSGATQSGENRKWKMLALENDAGMKE